MMALGFLFSRSFLFDGVNSLELNILGVLTFNSFFKKAFKTALVFSSSSVSEMLYM